MPSSQCSRHTSPQLHPPTNQRGHTILHNAEPPSTRGILGAQSFYVTGASGFFLPEQHGLEPLLRVESSSKLSLPSTGWAEQTCALIFYVGSTSLGTVHFPKYKMADQPTSIVHDSWGRRAYISLHFSVVTYQLP